VTDEPEGPCRAAFRATTAAAIASVATDPVCGAAYNRCVGNYECRAEIGEGIQAGQWQASELHFEQRSNICAKTWQFQELYECIDSKDIGIRSSDGAYAWRRDRCVPDDKLPGGVCQAFTSRLASQCPGANTLTAGTAASYQCSDNCAKAIVSAYDYCGTTWFNRVRSLPEASQGAYYTLVSRNPNGPCTDTLQTLLTATMTKVEADPVCGIRYDVCAASERCLFEMREGVIATIYGNADAERAFEETLCSKVPRRPAASKITPLLFISRIPSHRSLLLSKATCTVPSIVAGC
jgi:hypothetical protein